MGYANRLLTEGEELRAELRPHPVRLFAPGLLLVVAIAGAVAIGVELPEAPVEVAWLLAAMVVLPALWLAVRFVRWRAVRLLVTATRIVYRRGVLRRDIVQLRLQRLAEVHCTQSLLDRMIGCGRLVLEVVGDDPLVVEDVRRPRSVQRMIGSCLDDLATYRPYPVPEAYSAPATYTAPAAYPVPAYPVPDDHSVTAAYPAHDPYAATASPAPLRMAPEPARAPIDTPPHGIAATAAVPKVLDGAHAPDVPGRTPADRDRTDWLFDGRSDVPSAPRAAPPGDSIPARLIQLDELRRRGIISPQEFAAKKTELLSRL